MKCIYCLEDKPSDSFKKTEHVLPRSFGGFKNNLTLNKIVCDTCNQYFGDNLERPLGRETLEGMERFDHNIKKRKDFKPSGKKGRLNIKVEEGPLKGAYAYREYSAFEDDIVLKPSPQVGFKKVGGTEYSYFLLENIPEKDYLDKNYDLKELKSIVVLGCKFEEAQKCLEEKNIIFHKNGDAYPSIPDSTIDCGVTGTIDQIIFRAIAKIAFNYFVYWGEKIGFNKPFDPIRRYIRYGEKASFPFVVILEKAILGDEPEEGKRRLGHLITFDWSKNRLSLVAQVSLFNWMTYSVLLAKDIENKTFCLSKGNFFNVANMEILELTPGDSVEKDNPQIN